jgi:hypothetical protein
MPSERFMRHHYGASGYVDLKVQKRRKAIQSRLAEIEKELEPLRFACMCGCNRLHDEARPTYDERRRLTDELKAMESRS